MSLGGIPEGFYLRFDARETRETRKGLDLGRNRGNHSRKESGGFLDEVESFLVDSLLAGFTIEKWARVMEINRRDNWYEGES